MKQAVLVAMLLVCSCKGTFEQVGSIPVISTRQVDLTRPNVLLARGVEGTAKTKGRYYRDAAVDAALAKVPGGAVLVNVTFSVNTKKNTFRAVGDVWGQPLDTLSR